MGAQKVKTNFDDIENAALQKDKDREQLATMTALQNARSRENEAKRM